MTDSDCVGLIVGAGSSSITLGESAETSNADETLVGHRCIENSSGGTEMEEVMLSASIDCGNGELSWTPEDTKVAKDRAVAMSLMSSMLRDTDRNELYKAAIEAAILSFIKLHNRRPIVLDIGAGTGLLSMLAARADAEHVYACEMFNTMADIAKEVTELNCPGKITVFAKRSTDVTIQGESSTKVDCDNMQPDNTGGGDMPRRADMLINEIYDSGLLREGVIVAVRDAIDRLLVKDPIVMPKGAVMYGQLVSSASLRQCHDISDTEIAPNIKLCRSEDAEACVGGRVPYTLHSTSLADLVTLTQPFKTMEFDFAHPDTLLVKDATLSNDKGAGANKMLWARRFRDISVQIDHSGEIDGVLCWWDLHLWDGITYRSKPGAQKWQDHWLQCIFPLIGAIDKMNRLVTRGNVLHIKASHTDLSPYFEISQPCIPQEQNLQETGAVVEVNKRQRMDAVSKDDCDDMMEPCSCGWHMQYTPDRLAALNNKERAQKLYHAVQHLVNKLDVPVSQCISLDLCDGGVGTCMCIAAGVGMAVSLEPRETSRLLVGQTIRRAGVEEQVHVIPSLDQWPIYIQVESENNVDNMDTGDKVDVNDVEVGDTQHNNVVAATVHCQISEPYHTQLKNTPLLQALSIFGRRVYAMSYGILEPSTICLPTRALIRAAVYELPDISMCHGKVDSVMGFNHGSYDKHLEGWETYLYPYSLWQYKRRCLSEPTTIGILDYQNMSLPLTGVPVDVTLTSSGKCDAVVIWVDYALDDEGDLMEGWTDSSWSNMNNAASVNHENTIISTGIPVGHGKQLVRFIHSTTNCGAIGDKVTVQASILLEKGAVEIEVL